MLARHSCFYVCNYSVFMNANLVCNHFLDFQCISNEFTFHIVMVPTLRTIMNSSYYYEYQENIHLGVKSLTLAVRLTFNTLLPMLYLYFHSIYLFHIIPSLCLSFGLFTGPQHIYKLYVSILWVWFALILSFLVFSIKHTDWGLVYLILLHINPW